jgi:hypothetical protein
MVMSGSALGTQILDALGIDKSGVRKLTLECEAGCLATINVEYAIDDDVELDKIVKRYTLTEAA